MTFKRMISACTPSYFVDAVRARRFARELAEQQQRDREEIERERAAREAISWEDAVTRAGQYNADELTRFRIARSTFYQANGTTLQGNILNLVARMMGRSDISVTDFGGSTGELGKDFIAEYPGSIYTVVELPALVRSMASTQSLRFVTEIPTACDIFYSSGVLQYLEHPMNVLRNGFQSSRHTLVLRRNYFSDEHRFGIQHSRLFENGFGPVPEGFRDAPISYPRQTLVEREVIDTAAREGFRCILNIEDVSSPGGYGKQLVFLRA